MSQMKTTLTIEPYDYLIGVTADMQKAEPQTWEYPGYPAHLENVSIVSVHRELIGAKKTIVCPMPRELFPKLWTELETLLDAKVEKSGIELLEQLAEQMGDRYDD